MSLLVLMDAPPFNSPPAERGGKKHYSSLAEQGWEKYYSPPGFRGGSKGGVEIGVYVGSRLRGNDNKILVGSGVLQEGVCGIAVWGDDPTTEEVDGALEDQPLEVRVLSGEGGHSCPPPYSSVLSGDAVYSTDGFAVIRLEVPVEIPEKFGITSAYPNPFNSQMQISYGLPETADVKLNVYDISGRLVTELVSGHCSAGIHTVMFDGTNLASGVYLIQFDAAGHSSQYKVALVK